MSDHAAAQHQHFGGLDTRNATQQDAFSALRLFKETGTFLYGHAAGDFTHGDQQRKRTVRILDRFVC